MTQPDITKGISFFLKTDQITEVRAFGRNGSYPTTWSGYFTDPDTPAAEVAKISKNATGVYFIPNPVNPALLARANNRLRVMGKDDASTSDADILRRRWLLIDCDPARPSGISSTNHEHEAALQRAADIRETLRVQGWPEPVYADSGNGGHLMYAIDLPVDEGGLVKRCLEALAFRFDDEAVHIDRTVFNPARIWRLYGCVNRKGDDTSERPHRLSRLLEAPDTPEIVPVELLEALASTLPEEPKSGKSTRVRAGESFDLERWIADHGLQVSGPKSWNDGSKWVFETCPWNPEHTNRSAFIVRFPSGAVVAGCHHNGCAGNGWRELRTLYEPDAYDKKGKPTGKRKKPKAEGVQKDSSAGDFPLTDLGNAERLIAAHDKDLRYDVDSGKWLVWNGKLWKPDVTGEVDRLARGVVRSMYDLLKDCGAQEERDALYSHIKRSESAPRLSAMVSLARHCPDVPVQSNDLDADKWLLNCENGTVDLRTGKLRPHRREDLITRLVDVPYNPAAKCERWEKFLSEVLCEDLELAYFVKRMCGYLLTGETREQCFFLLVGKGSNGKGVFTETLTRILADYSRNTPVTTFLERRDSNTSDLASLAGARLVTASEGEDTSSFNESLLKRLTGEDPITCRHLYQEHFTYVPTFKMLFATNEVPRIKSQNYAMKRRVKLIPFRQRFYYPHEQKYPARDESLKEKLMMEKAGILAWMAQGCLEWRKDGLNPPASIISEVDSLFESMDPLLEFIETRCEMHPGREVESGMLWKAYTSWCEEQKYKPAYKRSSDFSRAFIQRDGIEARRTKEARYLQGIGLLSDVQVTPGDAKTVFSKSPP